MGDRRNKYILLRGRVGQTVERNLLTLGLYTKSTPTQVLRGDLLEALPEAEQPQDSPKIALAKINRNSVRLECTMEYLMRLSDEDANLLLAVSSLEERYQTFVDRIRLDFGRKLLPGCTVYVSVEGVSRKLPGIVWYKGELSSNNGTMFGVELIDNPGQGTSDGTFGHRKYFTCRRNSGVFVGLHKITPREDPESKSPPKSNITQLKETVIPSFLKGKNEPKSSQGRKDIEKGERVVTFLDDNYLARGFVRYIGEHKDPRGNPCTYVGLELDTMDGNGNGKLNGKQLFVCRRNFAFFCPIECVIPEKDFLGDNPKNNTGQRTSGEFKIQDHMIHDMIAGTLVNTSVYSGHPLAMAMEQQLTSVLREKQNSQRQLRVMEQQVARMEQQPREQERLSSEREQQLTNLQRQLREKELQEASLQHQLREKDQREENSQRQLREIQQQLREKDEQEENLQSQLREIEQQLREEEDQKENLQRQLREVEQQLTNLQGQFQENKDEMVSLQEQVTTLDRQLNVKDQQVNELEITLSTAQQALSEHQRRQFTPDWVTSRDQIQLTDKLLGRGGWGSVVEGKYCGCSVAVKQIHELILSPHNRSLFEREMDIASRCRHPCLLQFIGATNDEGSPLFVTELMESSLRALLEQRPLSATEVSIISLDVARALNYLHQKKPSPIIHRDISSANVLLWRQGDQWRGKVSDYGTANFMQHTMTAAPGAMIYIAPEALTSNQTVKVDVYSFGVLLCEMCVRELPDPERRYQQIAMVTNRLLRALIRGCLQSEPEVRPNMEEIIEELEEPV